MFDSGVRAKYTLVVSLMALGLAACGYSSEPSGAADSAGTSPAAAAPAASGRGLRAFTGDNICDILAVSALQSEFGAPADVTVQPSSSRRSWRCSYSWPRPDAEARQQAAFQHMMKQATLPPDQRDKLDLRAMATDFSISVSLAESKSTAADFVPAKLDEAQLEARVRAASEAANNRLTEEQKKALGDGGTESLTAKLIRAANARVEVEGVGDAAYWLPAMGGSLQVLSGDLEVTISPVLADDEQANIDGAKRVFGLLGD